MPVFKLPNGIFVLFIHIPKSGGTSVERFFLSQNAEMSWFDPKPRRYVRCSPQHMHREMLQENFKLNQFDLIFTIVRHPIKRLVSEYKFSINRHENRNGFDDWYHNIRQKYKLNKYVSDNHIRPQSEFLVDNCQIYKLEGGLESPMYEIFKALDLYLPKNIQIPRKMDNKNIVQRYKEAKTQEINLRLQMSTPSQKCIEIIREDYAEDFQRFDYRL